MHKTQKLIMVSIKLDLGTNLISEHYFVEFEKVS